MPLLDIINLHELQVMRSAQIKLPSRVDSRKILELTKHCFANLVLRINLVELPDILQIAYRKPFPDVLR